MNNLSSLLTYYPKSVAGVTTSFLHMGMWSNSVGIHIDDHDLISLNYLHHGAPKVWYIIHPSSYTKFEELVNKLKLFSDVSSSCLSPLQHKSLLIRPSFLQLHSIEFYQIEQKLNELILIFPGTYHFYFDTGFNLSETVKYALPSWLDFQRRSPRLCSCSISSATIMINRRFFTNEILQKFQEEHLKSMNAPCIDLSIDDEHKDKSDQIPTENEILDAPLYTSSSSSIESSIDIISPLTTQNELEDIWSIFQQISTQANTPSIENPTHHPKHFHPYAPNTPSTYPSYIPSYPYPSYFKRRLTRRRCYQCRERGHIRQECPYLPY